MFGKECPIPLVGNDVDLPQPKNRHEKVDINLNEAEVEGGKITRALAKVLSSVNDMRKEFVTWTTRVSNIENQLNQNSSICQSHIEEDCLSVHPPISRNPSDEVDQLSQDNSAIEVPLAGSEPPLADIRSDYSHSTVPKEGPEGQNSDQPWMSIFL